MSKIQKASPAPNDDKIKFIRAVIDDAMDTAELAVNKAIQVGQLLIEYKPIIGHGNFQQFITENFPRISYDTAHRWMQAASNVVKQVDLSGSPFPVSGLLSMPAEDLPDDAAREAQQLIFDFTKDKTIRDCLAAVVVDGDEPHRITRAANGKKHGGTKGEDRKNWPQFIGEKLSDISAHLKFWRSYSAPQVEEVGTKLKSFVGKAPTPFLTLLKDTINQELKTR